ncbi:MAG: tetratricopeptide repeat protein [Gemmatimonadales bacterium]
MTESAAPPSGGRREATPTPQAFWTTFLLLFVVIAVLFSLDSVLARIDRDESRSAAASLYREGRELAAAGDFREAVDRFRSAVFTVRGNREYQLALGEALVGAGKPTDAEIPLAELLQRDATWGPANLAMARTLVAEDRLQGATSYYHRAIYGKWDSVAAERRVAARFELIQLLVDHDSRADLLAELLPLLGEAPDSVAIRRRLGHLFVLAGSPDRATTIFQQMLREDPADADAHAGLAEASFARGNYRSARSSWLTAGRLAPGDTIVPGRLALVDQILSLDPSQRGIGSTEQFRRSRILLELASGQLRGCAPGGGPAAADLLDSARVGLERRVRSWEEREATEANLDLAERVWQVRETGCAVPAAADDPVALVLARLAQ